MLHKEAILPLTVLLVIILITWYFREKPTEKLHVDKPGGQYATLFDSKGTELMRVTGPDKLGKYMVEILDRDLFEVRYTAQTKEP